MRIDESKAPGIQQEPGTRLATPVAVIGAACRLPGAAGVEEFWELLRSGVDAVRELPEARRDTAGAPAVAGYLDRVDTFDPEFFGISPREATAMDPQQRLLLELGWEALEEAGTLPAALHGTRTAVLAAAIWDDYAELTHSGGPAALTHHSFAGTRRAMLANRLSHTFGLTGPSLTVDTGQSSSLVAVHLACELLRTGEADAALVGGANLVTGPGSTATSQRMGALSPTGRCHTFDARADGYVRGEGGAVLVLKPLDRAQADGDRILGVIRGSAVNNDGDGDSLGVPRRETQEEVVRLAHRRAGTDPAAVHYVELHGTGTPVGDPVEAAALGAVAGVPRPAGDPLPVGSLKTNIGHLEGAAGIAGLLKVLLAVGHRELPATLHHTTPNPRIPLDALNLRVQTSHTPWPRPDSIPLAGVSSFGLGGTNCHVVVEGPRPAETAPDRADRSQRSDWLDRSHPLDRPAQAGPVLWPLSGTTPHALRGQAARLRRHLTRHPGAAPADIGYSFATTRTPFRQRAVALAHDLDDLTEAVTALAEGRPDPRLIEGTPTEGTRGPVFVFPGQGAQWSGMGLELAAAFPVFDEALSECAQVLEPFVDWDLRSELAGDLSRVDVVQPASWAVMVSLARLWQSFGVEPSAVVGHSQGEIAAAVVAGALSLEDGARIVAERSRVIGERLAGRGGMMSIAMPAAAVRDHLRGHEDRLALAAVNGPSSTVVSGDPIALEELRAALEAEATRVRRIAVDYASHSSQVESVRDELLQVLAPVTPRDCEVPFHSTVTGGEFGTTGLDAAYWVRNLRSTVEFEATTGGLIGAGHEVFVEMSAHPVLAVGLQDSGAAVIGSLRRDDGGRDRFLVGLATAWANGLAVDLAAVFHGQDVRRCPLPTYAFQRERYWLAGSTAAVSAGGMPAAAAGTGPAVSATHATNAADATDVASATPVNPAGDSAPYAFPLAHLAGRTADQQRWALLELVRRHAAAVLGHTNGARVESDRTFKDAGFDSQMTVELQSSLNRATGLRLPSGVLYSHPTPATLAQRLHADLLGATASAADPDTGTDTADTIATADPNTRTEGDAIAVVGMACRFPGGVTSPEDLWRLVADGTDAIGPFPADRGWDLGALYNSDPEHSGTSYVRHGGFLDGAAEFDAGFFGISPREAQTMDPQQRLLLETSWEAVERAGIVPETLRGTSTGVFAGAMAMEYGSRLHEAPEGFEGQILTGTAGSVLSGRVAYGLGLQGPAVTVDTACSSSLVALHLAAQAVRQGDCSIALAGGVTVMPNPGMFLEFSRQRGLSPEGRCKAFGSGADGTGWAEGVGVLVLERLRDARRNGHTVLAVLRGSAVNQDGASNGLTAPNGDAQQRVIRQALRLAGLTADDVDAVEAHGTGTRLGDPIEAQALLATYGQDRDSAHPLRLGSLKSNIGHAQAAAGVGGVIKTVMALRHGILPRTLHATEPSPHVDWSTGGVSLLTEAEPWPDRGRPRRAAVSSFGISGTNAHVILEAAPRESADSLPGSGGPAEPQRIPSSPTADLVPAHPTPVVWSLSARSAQALAAQARNLRAHVEAHEELDPADIGYSLATTRARLEHRAVVIGRDREELLPALTALADGAPSGLTVTGTTASTSTSTSTRPVFVFPGQGAQWSGMGLELAAAFPVFDTALSECAEALRPLTDWDLRAELAGDLSRVDVVQPASWAVMVSLARLWQSFGVEPSAVVGHSQGEIAAAVVAGALSLEDGARIVAERSRVIRRRLAGRGGMAAVALPVDIVRARLVEIGEGIEVAAVNGPTATVVSGEPDALDALLALLEPEGVRVRRIAVDYASHSSHVDSVRDELLETLALVRPRPSSVPFHSTVTCEIVDTAELDAAYWVRNLRHTVEFATAVEGLAAEGHGLYVEMSPHPVLAMAVEEAADGTLTAVGSLRRDDGGPDRYLASLAEAHVHGATVDWAPTFPGATAVDLPTYAFQRQRHWMDSGTTRRTDGDHPLAVTVVRLADGDGALLTGTLSRATASWIPDHAVTGDVLLPGTAFVELVLSAGEQVGCARLEELTLQAPLPLPEDASVRLQVAVRAPDTGTRHRPFTVHTRPADAAPDAPWTCHATGFVAPASAPATPAAELTAWPPPGAEPLAVEKLYAELAALGHEYGPAFRGLTTAWRRGTKVFADIALPTDRHAEAAAYGVHPALLDACLHAALLDRIDAAAARPALPFAWSGVELHATGATAARVRITPGEPGSDTVTVTVTDTSGLPLADVEALVLREAPAATGPRDTVPDGLYRIDWVPTLADDPQGTDWGHYGDPLPDPVPPVVVTQVAPGTDVTEAVAGALHTVQRWLADGRCASSRLVFALTGDTPAEAAVAGLVRSAQTEHPGRFTLVHVLAAASDADLAAVAATDEPELRAAVDGHTVPRLARATAHRVLTPPAEGLWRVDVTTKGALDHLSLLPAPAAEQPLKDGQVRVRMAAAGLNFRDVIVSLGMVPGLEGIGVEGAGTVVETAPDVRGLALGDRVMGLLPDAMAPVAVADARTLVRVPDGWTFRQAASAPVIFLTAWLGLVEGAELRPGDRVLVHTATGGLGLAALQLARRAGAEVFATASPAKHDFLRELGLDNDHIASSRDLGFRDHFHAVTGGAGMDVVMNTLSGEFTDASLELLPRGGRFVEMGKTDVRDPHTVAADHPGVRYLYFDLLSEEPDRVHDGLTRLAEHLADGELRLPLITSWDIRHALEAFETLRGATHLGKIVLTLPHTWDPARTVLITGGTGTLGSLLARHLVTEHGVHHLLLTSRRGPAAEGADRLAGELRDLGANADIVACDAGDREALGDLLAGIPADRPLGAVVHTAGLLDDATVEAMTPQQVDRVLRAKVHTAELLDELTAGAELDAFVLFSSVAGVLGTAGQANYAAANAALDALALRRRRQGRPAVSVAWGLWEQASGMTGHLDGQDVGRLSRTGVAPLRSADGLALFDAALAADVPQVVAARLDHTALREQASAALPAVLRAMGGTARRRATAVAPEAADEATLGRRLAAASPGERAHAMLDLVRTHAATVLRLASAQEVDDDRPFREVGFDSLTAVELRNRLNTATGLRLPSTVIFRHPTPAQLADRLHTELFPQTDGTAATAVLADLDRLSGSLTGLGGEERTAVAERLRQLLREADGTGADDVLLTTGHEDLENAADDEMFALIDKELEIE